MLSAKVVEFYGLKESDRCEDVARAMNGLLGFVETHRRVSLEVFFTGIVRVVEDMQRIHVELTNALADKQQHAILQEKFNKIKIEMKALLKLNDDLNLKIKDLEDGIKKKNECIESLKQTAQKTESDLTNERTKNQKLIAEKQKSTAEMQEDLQKRKLGDATTKLPAASSSTSATGLKKADVVNKAAEAVAPKPAVQVNEIKRENARLLAENARLESLVASLTAPAEIPASVAEIFGKEEKKTRFSSEEVSKLRTILIDQAKRLESIGSEARLMAKKYSEDIEKKEDQWKADVDKLKSKIRELEKGKEGMIPEASEPVTNEAGRNLQLEQTLLSNLASEAHSLSHRHVSLSSFAMMDGSLMECPVPTRTGMLVQLKDVYKQWVLLPSDNEGTFYATFRCPYSARITSMASSEQVYLVQRIASDLGMRMETPLQFQYMDQGAWTNLLLFDQVAVAALCCKLYRSGVKDGVETTLVCQGMFLFSIHLLDSAVQLQVQSAYNHNDVRPACLLSCNAGHCGLFDRWKFCFDAEEMAD